MGNHHNSVAENCCRCSNSRDFDLIDRNYRNSVIGVVKFLIEEIAVSGLGVALG